MKNRIDLYTQDFRPQTYLINPSFTAAVWLFLLILVIASFTLVSLQKSAIEDELAQVRAQLEEQQRLVNVMAEGLAKRQQDPALLAKVDAQSRALEIQQLILTELGQRERKQHLGFSNLMLDLAKYHGAGLWLTDIVLDGESIEIKGQASDSAAVPQWVEQLKKTQFFQGKQFGSARLFRSEQDQLQFELSSELQITIPDAQQDDASAQGAAK